MAEHTQYPSPEYNARIAAIVEQTKQDYYKNPETAKQKAEEALKHMGLLENGQAKKQIVTTSHHLLKQSDIQNHSLL